MPTFRHCFVLAALLGSIVAALSAAAPPATCPASAFRPLDADSIIFVSDCSGSMLCKFDPLRAEVRKAVSLLGPKQKFNLVFMREEAAGVLSRESLLDATDANKQKADDFLSDTSPRGSTNPIPALRLAFAQQPQAIFLLTDGDFPDNDELIAEIRKLNKDHKVRVSTIAFVDHGDSYEKLLQQIAKENGGTFRFVSDEDLGP